MNHEDTLRRLAMNDPACTRDVLRAEHSNGTMSPLDAKGAAFARLGALVGVGATASSFRVEVEEALAAGAQIDEIVGILVAVAPAVGLARVAVAAGPFALAIGLDLEEELEHFDEPVAGQTNTEWP